MKRIGLVMAAVAVMGGVPAARADDSTASLGRIAGAVERVGAALEAEAAARAGDLDLRRAQVLVTLLDGRLRAAEALEAAARAADAEADNAVEEGAMFRDRLEDLARQPRPEGEEAERAFENEREQLVRLVKTFEQRALRSAERRTRLETEAADRRRSAAALEERIERLLEPPAPRR